MDVTPVSEIYNDDENTNECILNCQKVHGHTKSCPVCSQLYYSYINTYIKGIILMLIIIILLLMFKINRLK